METKIIFFIQLLVTQLQLTLQRFSEEIAENRIRRYR